MFYVKYRDFFGELQVLPGRSEFEDAESEAEDCASTGGNSEVEILVSLETADDNLKWAGAYFTSHPPTERDDGTQAAAMALR
jgi:hypothetical protein